MQLPGSAGPLLFWLMVLLVVELLAATGCVPIKNEPSWEGPKSAIELDENTDPRFYWHPRDSISARIKVLGHHVKLNHRKAGHGDRVPYGASVRTSRNSWAKIEFTQRSRACEISVRDFRSGRIFGTTQSCMHSFETRQGSGESTRESWYVVETDHRSTKVIVLSGRMDLRLPGDRKVRATVKRREYAVMEPGREIQPRKLDRKTYERLRARRINYPPWPSTSGPSTPGGAGPSANLVRVPDLQNRSRDSAAALLSKLGLKMRAKGRPSPRDLVSSQRPQPGAKVKRGSSVDVSFQAPAAVTVKVPNLQRKSYREASSILKRLGLKIGVKGRPDSRDLVSSQSPRSGTEVKKGSIVNVRLKAATAQMVTVPNLTNKGLREATATLRRLGLTARVTPREAKKMDNKDYIVIKQTPKAGKKIERGATVTIEMDIFH